MNIIYSPTVVRGAYKAFYNYIKFRDYDINLIPQDFLNIPDLLECLTGYENHNRVISTLSLFFVHSFIKHDFSIDFFRQDYEVVKEELNYEVDFTKIYEKIRIIDGFVEDTLAKSPEWAFLRSFEDLEFFQLYFAYRLKNRGVKIVFGKEKEFKKHLKSIFMMDEFSDHVFVGHGEHFLDAFCSNSLTEKYSENLEYTKDFLESFNHDLADLEIKDHKYNFSFHTLCPYKCVFCSQNKGNNLKLNTENLDEVIDKFIFLNKKYDIESSFCISSLPFYTNAEIEYFFSKIYDEFKDTVKFNIVHLTTPQYLENAELLTKFTDSLFYVGVEHFSDKILTLMKKPTTKEQNLKLLLNKKYSNAGFGLIYNFFKEDLNDFNEMIQAIKIARKYQPHRFFKLNSFQYMIPEDFLEDRSDYDISFVEPVAFKNYFNVDINFYLNYRNAHDPDLSLLKKKNEIAIKNGIDLY